MPLPDLKSLRDKEEEENRTLLDAIASGGMTGAELLFNVLDAPANYFARPLLAGKEFGETASPGELLDSWGMRPDEDAMGGWSRPLTEFAAGAIADPLNLVSLGGATAAKTALKGAGRIDDALKIAGRNYLDDAVKNLGKADDYGSLTGYSRSALEGLEDAGLVRGIRTAKELDQGKGIGVREMWKNTGVRTSAADIDELKRSAAALTDEDLLARPLVGRGVSERRTSLDDVMEQLEKKPIQNKSALDAIEHSAKGLGKNVDDLRGQKLRNDIGIRLPFSDVDLIGTQLPGGEAVAGFFDRAGQMLRWGGPGRFAANVFDSDVMGQTDEGGQIIAKQLSRAARQGAIEGKQEFMRAVAKLDSAKDLTGTDSSAVRSYIETGAAPSTAFSPEMQDFVDNGYETLMNGIRQRRIDSGMSESLLDDAAAEYFPRQATEGVLTDRILRGEAASDGRQVSTPDQIARKTPLLNLEGGTEDLNRLSLVEDASGNRLFGGRNRVYQTDDRAAEEIIKSGLTKVVNKQTPTGTVRSVEPVDMEQARAIARVLHKLDDNILDEGAGLFSNHWTKDLEEYVINNNRAFAISDRMNEILARQARTETAGKVAGGKAISVTDALENLGLRSFTEETVDASGNIVKTFKGAGQRLYDKMDSLGKITAKTPGLDAASIKEVHVNQLKKLHEVTEMPEAMRAMFEDYYDPIVNMWKASILARPARFFRDWLSGIFVNQVEVGRLDHTMRGYHAQHALMHGDWDTLAKEMADVPRYQGLKDDALRQAVQNDVATSGILEARRDMDLSSRVAGSRTGSDVVNKLRPGDRSHGTWLSNNVARLTGGKTAETSFKRHLKDPFLQDPGQFGKDLLSVGMPGFQNTKDIRSPIFQWSAELGLQTDFINRGAGYFGLLMQGVDPMEAGRRMLAGHVDYSTLTSSEAWIRRFIPFYAYTSRIGRWMAGKIAENPGGRYTQMNLRLPQSFLDDDDGYTPSELRHSYGFKLDKDNWLNKNVLGAREGEDLYLADLDLPGVDTLNLLTPKFGPDGTPSVTSTIGETVGNIFGMANPLIKGAVETATGTSLYTGQPKKDFKTNYQRLVEPIAGEGAGRVVNFFDPLLQFVPYAGHLAQTAKYAGQGDDAISMAARSIMPNAFGFKAKGYDEEDVLQEQQRLLASVLTEDPEMRTWTDIYLPKHLKQTMEKARAGGDLQYNELLDLVEAKAVIAGKLKKLRDQKKAAER